MTEHTTLGPVLRVMINEVLGIWCLPKEVLKQVAEAGVDTQIVQSVDEVLVLNAELQSMTSILICQEHSLILVFLYRWIRAGRTGEITSSVGYLAEYTM